MLIANYFKIIIMIVNCLLTTEIIISGTPSWRSYKYNRMKYKMNTVRHVGIKCILLQIYTIHLKKIK